MTLETEPPSAAAAERASAGPGRPTAAQAMLLVSGILVVLGVAVGQRTAAVIGAAAVLVVLAVTRFEVFVLAALVIRSAIDSSKNGSPVELTTALGAAFLVFVVVHELLERTAGAPRPGYRAPFRRPLQAFLAAAVVSALASEHVTASLTETIRLAGVVAMVIALERVLGRPGAAQRVLIAVLASAIVPMLVGLQQASSGAGLTIGGFSRITGTYLHPNPFSIFLAMLIVLAVALLPHVIGRLRLALFLGAATATLLLLLTYTRGSWIALIAGLLVIGAIQSRALVVSVVVGCAAVFLMVPNVSGRFADLQTETRYSGAPANSLVWRVDYWREVIDLANDSPVIGIGLTGIESSTSEQKNAHNDLVRVYVETGVVGLLSYLALAWTLVRTAVRSLRITEFVVGWRRGAAVGCTGVLAVLAVVSVSSNVITQVVLLWYAVAIATLAHAAVASARTGEPDETDETDRSVQTTWR